MSIESSRNADQKTEYGSGEEQLSGPRSMGSASGSLNNAAKSLTNPSLLIGALGLSFLYAVNQGMRITTLAGIYPVEGSLVLRHILAVAALLAVVFALGRKRGPKGTPSVRVYLVMGVLLSAALAARYSSLFVAAPPLALELAGKLTEEALGALLVLFWARLILQEGLVAMAVTVAYAFLAQAAIQLLLSFLQRVPCAVVLCILPLASVALYHVYLSTHPSLDEAAAGIETPAASARGESSLFPLGLIAAIIFLLSFILGGVIFESLDAQNAMADEPLAQLCIIAGNVAAGLGLLFAAPHVRDYSYGIILLLTCFACSAVSLYLTTFLVDAAVGGYLFASSVGLQSTRMLIWCAPLLIGGGGLRPFRNYILLCVSFTCAKVLSSVCMMLHRTYFDYLFNVLVSVSMVALFCCCAIVVARSFSTVRADAARQMNGEAFPAVLPAKAPAEIADSAAPASVQPAPAAPEAEPEPEKRAFFREAVDSLADEYGLTRQERRVLMLVAKGLNAGAISEEMVVSVNTAKSHMRNAYAKLNVHSQQEIIALVNERKAELRDAESQ